MRRIITTLLLCSALGAGHQDPDPQQPELKADYRGLLIALATEDERGERPTRTQRITLIEAFLARRAAGAANAPQVLAARVRLGSLRLTGFELTAARDQFDAVIDRASSRDLDFLGRALYGNAQVEELLGSVAKARRLLLRLTQDLSGTRYADYARTTLTRLEEAATVRTGNLAPLTRPCLDLANKSRSLLRLRGKPALLLFWTPEDPAGVKRVDDLCRAARTAGLPWEQILAFGLTTDQDRLRRVADEQGWEMPIVASPTGFLDPTVMTYRVTSVPTSFLIDADGTLLARDLTPARLTPVLRKLLRR